MKTNLLIGLLSCGLMLNIACEPQRTDDPVDRAQDISEERTHHEDQTIDVLTEAASYNMLNMELAQIAQERAVSPETKSFAQELAKEHSDVKSDLEGLAQRKQIELPAGMSDDHRDKIENVTEKTGLDFDKEFVDEVISTHRDKIDDFESLSRDSEDPEIREFAINMLPKLRMQLEKAERVEAQLDRRDDAQADDGVFNGDGDTYRGDDGRRYQDDGTARDRGVRDREDDRTRDRDDI
jgi:putative membrane protein